MSGRWAGTRSGGYDDPEWRATRSRILRRDGRRCQWPRTSGGRLWTIDNLFVALIAGARPVDVDICGQTGHNVDHIANRARGGAEDDANLWTLCVPHHRTKTSAEGNRTKVSEQRPAERHPGMV